MNLISAESLADRPTDYLVIDCRFSLADTDLGEQQYRQGHIPGAFYAHLDKHLSGKITPESGRHPLPEFESLLAQLEQWGINQQSRVVAYDNTAGGHAYAARLWWLLRTLGISDVAVLNGGIEAWQAAGLSLVSGQAEAVPTQFKTLPDSNTWRDTAYIQEHLAKHECVVIDARAKERFDGLVEPIDPVAGHIPGSVNMPVSKNMDEQGFLLPVEALRENYLKVMGETAPDQVIHSCGSGVFACLGVLAMEIAGLSGSKIYPGSWSEWIREPARGVATS
ncbi:MAG: sulfurtransferase [Desulfobacterales bacterium]|nr:sulfurtransferase [Desulfobacterales bacterium]